MVLPDTDPLLYRRNSILLLSCYVLRDSLVSVAAMLYQEKALKTPHSQHSTQSTVCDGRPEAHAHQRYDMLFTDDNVLCKRMIIVGGQTFVF